MTSVCSASSAIGPRLAPTRAIVRRPFCRAHSKARTRLGELPLTLLPRSEEHTSELQSRPHLVCRLLLEKKNRPIAIFSVVIICANFDSLQLLSGHLTACAYFTDGLIFTAHRLIAYDTVSHIPSPNLHFI